MLQLWCHCSSDISIQFSGRLFSCMSAYLPATTRSRDSAFSSGLTSRLSGSSSQLNMSFSCGTIYACQRLRLWAILCFTYSLSLFQNSHCPVKMFYQGFRTSRCPCNEVQSPWNLSKNRHGFQTLMQEFNYSIFLAFLEHAKTTTEPDVAHHVEAVEVDPVGDPD
jgi:hypothetical protein